jgi:hypothetical protein
MAASGPPAADGPDLDRTTASAEFRQQKQCRLNELGRQIEDLRIAISLPTSFAGASGGASAHPRRHDSVQRTPAALVSTMLPCAFS